MHVFNTNRNACVCSVYTHTTYHVYVSMSTYMRIANPHELRMCAPTHGVCMGFMFMCTGTRTSYLKCPRMPLTDSKYCVAPRSKAVGTYPVPRKHTSK